MVGEEGLMEGIAENRLCHIDCWEGRLCCVQLLVEKIVAMIDPMTKIRCSGDDDVVLVGERGRCLNISSC